MKSFYYISILILIFTACQPEKEPMLQKIYLDDNWEFSAAEEKAWAPAKVPGTVHADLQRNGDIPDPFYGCNEKDLQWIGESDWVYKTTFHVDEDILSNSNINLVFEGLDTYADVFLNGKMILQANNIHRKWEVDCLEALNEGDNILEVHFHSALNKFLEDSTALGYPLPGGRWVFARKAAYHFGWDWGPTFITAGIWKPVYLKAWNEHRPIDVQLYTTSITEKKADIKAEFYIRSNKDEKAFLSIKNKNNNRLLAREKLELSKDKEKYVLAFQIKNPVLWWTHDLGDPHLYDLGFEIKTVSGSTWKKTIQYGLRTIEVVTENDEYGESFYFKLNEVPVFMKGANYIPQHSFMTEVTEKDYENIIRNALKSNMNMLRIWGGGIYENDIFYELCDRHGILVWQDFMFACAMYPGDDDFVENVRQEAVQQVRRLRNHPSIAMWCGNNEVDEGWHNWQWQQVHNIKPSDSVTIWQNYKRVFHELLPDIIEKHDPGRYYLHTSPVHGWGHEESLKEGTAHYWGVWWGMEPFETYLEKVPRFMSEFGFQAMPTIATIRDFQKPGDDYLFSDALKCHQKHPTGYETITGYLEHEHLFPQTLQEYIYMSQLIQAKGVGMALEAHRKSQPRCMGTLYWQFNDCWPVTSWSGIDVNGNWKALQYKIRELFDDIMVSVIDHKGEIEATIVSGLLQEVNGSFELNVLDLENNRTTLYEDKITLPANKPHKLLTINSEELKSKYDFSKLMIEGVFDTGDGNLYRNVKFLKPYGKLSLPDAKVEWHIEETVEGFNITLSADAFAAHVQLYLTESHAWFEDNFFHLWPGEEKTVFCKTDLSKEEFEEQLQVQMLNNLNR